MIHFSIFKIPVRVEPFFWVTMALVSGRLFSDTIPEIFGLLLFILAGFISILVHELGHALTAKHFGRKVHIVLQAFGGYAAYESSGPINPKKTFAITAAGPLLQIALGLVVWAVYKSIPEISPYGADFLKSLIWVSFVWAILNLFPILPLDGGRLVQTVLGPGRIRITLGISIATGVFMTVMGYLYGQIFLAVFAGFMAYQSFQALQQIPKR